MSKPRGFIGMNSAGTPLQDAYSNVLLFKSPEDARHVGAVKVLPLVTARMVRKRKKVDEP